MAYVRVTLALFVASAAACTASESDVSPPRWDFYYPTGLALTPDENWLFVIGANADLRYDSGTVQVIDVSKVNAIADAWLATVQSPEPSCAALADRPHVLSCATTVDDDHASFMVDRGTVKIGNFGVDVGVQPLEQGGAPSAVVRAFATVRGDPSITWMDFDATTGIMDCGGEGVYPRCSELHRLDQLRNRADLGTLATEPYYLWVDPLGEHVVATHLTSGIVTLVTAPLEVGSAPFIADTIGGLFQVNSIGQLGATGVAGRLAGDPDGFIYVASRTEARVAMVHVAAGLPGEDGLPNEVLVRGPSLLLNGLSSGGNPNDARSLRFSEDGNRLYLINRSPPSLLVFDTSLDEADLPRNELIGSIEVCPQAAAIGLAPTRIYIPCFGTGQLWVLDRDELALVAVTDVGRGPNSVAVAHGKNRVFVANYAEDTVSVLDIRAGEPTENEYVMRLGRVREAGQ